ncbi:MAG: EAL domain-containing protein [Arenimonas sp.]
MERVNLSINEILFKEGDQPTVAFLIESGEIEISTIQDGETLVLSKLFAGELLGEMAVIDDAPRTATAKALTDCVLFQIDRTQISERLASTDPIIRALLEGQLKRYRGALAAMQGKSFVQDDGVTASEALGVGKIRLESQLREALNTGGLDVRYQPLLHVQSNKIAGYEALVRWNHPERGQISPVEFVALAEETSLIVPVGEYVFDTACSAVKTFIEHGADPKPFIAVNVSARQLSHPGLIERIVARVDAAGLPVGSLKVEITESQALNYDMVEKVISLCHSHGIKVALDDFGTGHSHLTHLHKLAFDTMKVDQAFSRSMLEHPRSMAIVKAIVAMGKAIDADIVVEGIETEEMLQALRDLGCDYAQGYLIGKPQTLEELLAKK